ncbi:copper oxidase, partial [Pseudomonas sp. MWU13-2625]
SMWAQMNMNPTDLADVSGATYTFLLNGQAPGQPWSGLFRLGERLRLRVINASAMSYFDLRIPGVQMTVVAADGQHVVPVTVDELRIAVAETFDVLVQPGAGAHALFAQAMDRSGYALGTLASAPGLVTEAPAMDPRPLLGMTDMAMGAMDHGAMPGMDHGAMAAMDHGAMNTATSHPTSETNNPLVDMQAVNPMPRLDDPGI